MRKRHQAGGPLGGGCPWGVPATLRRGGSAECHRGYYEEGWYPSSLPSGAMVSHSG